MRNKHILTGAAAFEHIRKLGELGLKTISQSNNSSNIKRWFDDNEIIEFTDCKKNYDDFNAKFQINNNANHEIWLSQLSNLFFSTLNYDILGFTSITLKGQEEQIIRPFTLCSDFWDIVNNKKFKVSVCKDCDISINLNSNEFWHIIGPNFQVAEFVEYYKKNMVIKNYKSLNGLVKAAKCYDFVEI